MHFGDFPGVGEIDDEGGGKVMESLMLVGLLVCGRGDTVVVEVGDMECFSVVPDEVRTLSDRIIDETTALVAEVVELGCTESIAVLPSALVAIPEV